MTQQEKFLEGSRRRLEEAALKYARMKVLGRYIDENGHDVRMCKMDAVDYLAMYQRNLLMAAEDLFAEISATPLPERVKS